MYSRKWQHDTPHLIYDIKEIKNIDLLLDPTKIHQILESLCDKYNFKILKRVENCSEDGLCIVYKLDNFHISLNTLPEIGCVSIDIYTCVNYPIETVYNQICIFLEESFLERAGFPKEEVVGEQLNSVDGSRRS